MESILESEWSVLDAMYSTQESDFMVQLLNYCSIPNGMHSGSNLTPSSNTNVDHLSQGTNIFHLTSNHDSYYTGDFNHILPTYDDFGLCNSEAENQVPDPELHKEVVFRNPVQKSKRRSTNSEDVQKNKRNVKAKKNHKLTDSNEQIALLRKQSSGSCSTESDPIDSQELNGVASNYSESEEAAAVNSNGQLRAVRGSATDSQSLYARKRREQINERLRTLQNLVPNGTKVDISTMLEDAVQYVKFLQLQIKLLSSDDKWMYAPIAYNGTDFTT